MATELPPPNFYFWQAKAGSKSLECCQMSKTLVYTGYYCFSHE
ncbi:hypothetical protein COO91_02833 [Nostoc flagelliforme CCNUN1]|uniref:Uncharacterized protein n=1 Tax=Nostoc flagelliforme CCNUN1 TaxID=2038116 RepID=A0A2K8SN47_9NOSO|nr:hypothetical protein COO91_02833 [Nostoc flagelliforme CCNUN1]